MQNVPTYRILNRILFLISVVVALGVWVYWSYVCGGHSCTLYLIDWFLTPLLWGGVAWSIIFGTMLFFPAQLFKRWLLHVGIWGMLIMIFVVLDTDPRSSSLWFPMDRGRSAWFSGVFVGAVTGLYILGTYAYVWKRTKTIPTPPSRLCILIVAFLFFYYFATM